MLQTATNKIPPYTKVLREAIEGLTGWELGLYTHMRSQNPNPDKWEFNIQYMAKQLSWSVSKARQTLNDLISKGLVERIETRIKGFLKYIYKVRDTRGEVRDDAKKMRKKLEEATQTIQIEEIKPTSIVVEETQKIEEKIEEKKEWRELFEGNEKFIDAFIADRKKYLSNTDYYKKNLGRAATDLEVESHINRKLNDKTSDMEARIKEFIATELIKEKNKAELEQQFELSEDKKLEIEMKDLISKEKIALSKKRLPDFWSKHTGFSGLGFFQAKVEAEQSIKDELEEIEAKYQAIYQPLIEKAKQ